MGDAWQDGAGHRTVMHHAMVDLDLRQGVAATAESRGGMQAQVDGHSRTCRRGVGSA